MIEESLNGYSIFSDINEFRNFSTYDSLQNAITSLFHEDGINTWGRKIIRNVLYSDSELVNYFTNTKSKEYGEVFTPKYLVDEILDKFESTYPDFFDSVNHTVIDNCAGIGNLLLGAINRFFRKTRKYYKSDDECYEHILKYQIYGIELLSDNYAILKRLVDRNNISQNLLCTDALKFDYWNNKKFDLVLSSPPFSKVFIRENGTKRFDICYDIFTYKAHFISARYVINILPQRCLYQQKRFSKELIYNRNIRNLVTFNNYQSCFKEQVSGGLLYYILDKEYNNENILDVEEIGYDNKRKTGKRYVRNYNGLYPRTLIGCSIIEKVKNKSEKMFSDIVHKRLLYGIRTNIEESNEGIPCIFSNKRMSFVKNVSKGKDTIDTYKFIVCYYTSSGGLSADNSGKMKILCSPQIVDKGTIFTSSYICIYNSPDRDSVENVKTYFETKFARYMLLQGLASHTILRNSFCFVPFLDFTKAYNDDMLYEYYGLSEEEIEEIESLVKESN